MSKTSDKKARLLKAAKELFGEYGYTETTFKRISDRAGVALGLLAHHYGSKEKIFLASGLDVLDKFQRFLESATQNASCGHEGVILFCKAYLEYSIDKNSNWLVLVRCSPYSDLKISSNRELMESRFKKIHELLEGQLSRGIEDKSVSCASCEATAQVIMALLVGANRTRVLTPYATETLYGDVIEFINTSIKK